MNFLKYYSPIVVSFALAMLLIRYVTSDFTDEISFIAIIIYTPIAVYLWRILSATK